MDSNPETQLSFMGRPKKILEHPHKALSGLRLRLCPLNPSVGAVSENARVIASEMRDAASAGIEILVFPELALSGYPPEDLLFRAEFTDAVRAELQTLAELSAETPGLAALVGWPERVGNKLYNSLAVLSSGEISLSYRKRRLPNYGVFDEKRYFTPGELHSDRDLFFSHGERRYALSICEDLWWEGSPSTEIARGGADLIINVSASPYSAQKPAARREMLHRRAAATGAPIAYCNLCGGQDELVFDGDCCVISPHSEGALAESELFECEGLDHEFTAEAAAGRARRRARSDLEPRPAPERWEVPLQAEGVPLGELTEDPGARLSSELYRALTLATRDYVRKSGFERVVLGLSGGIDSALVAQLAADALGAERVTALILPSPHSASETQADAHRLASELGIGSHLIEIDQLMRDYQAALSPIFGDRPRDVTEENIQARIRGNILMAYSNKMGALLLTTGNKSEMSVGYSTLYGDMAGGFAPLKDLPKLWVYRLCEWRLRGSEREGLAPQPGFPREIITRAPSAELSDDQRDSDSLPPYEILDPILAARIERDLSATEILAQLPQKLRADHSRERLLSEITRVISLIDRAEHKRRQAPPGPKISARAFGRDRRVPICSGFRSELLS